MVFHDDLARLCTRHGPANVAAVKHMARNPLKQAKPTISLEKPAKASQMDTGCLEAMIQQAT